MKLITSGAEAKIYEINDTIIKQRNAKQYRINEIDISLRKFRTKREAKILKTLNELSVNVPKIRTVDLKKFEIIMDKITGNKLRDKLKNSNYEKIAKNIAKDIAIIHNNNIIHGDLTTSNMILTNNNQIYFIDFGLSFFSTKSEDKAVDIHLFRQALESKHNKIWEKMFEIFIIEYTKKVDNAKEIIDRFKKVEIRGRNKNKNQ
ncbi:MAG: KEOPS complex kinase/ATPase Bud32 [Candidatus Woesearchaeota archaeon]